MRKFIFKTLFLAASLIACFILSTNAQKLPNVQQAGVYAPANVKIDGKPTEWDNKFQAYNKSSNISYTIANNADNLVLVVQTTDRVTAYKILSQKLTLTLSGINNIISVNTANASGPSLSNISSALRKSEPISDSLLNALNKNVSASFKQIEVKGIAEITDSKISVYNDHGIKVAGQLDAKKAYTCEMAIPLKYLTPVLSDAGSFNYTITVNGMKLAKVSSDFGGQQTEVTNDVLANSTFAGMPMLELMTDNEISGTYTLIKK